MILSYRDKRTRTFAGGADTAAVRGIERQARKRLAILDAATCLDDLAALPSNRLEALSGPRSGQFSIRINTQWRICFRWPEEATGTSDVEILDYH